MKKIVIVIVLVAIAIVIIIFVGWDRGVVVLYNVTSIIVKE